MITKKCQEKWYVNCPKENKMIRLQNGSKNEFCFTKSWAKNTDPLWDRDRDQNRDQNQDQKNVAFPKKDQDRDVVNALLSLWFSHKINNLV